MKAEYLRQVESEDLMKEYCRRHPEVPAMVILQEKEGQEEILRFGRGIPSLTVGACCGVC